MDSLLPPTVGMTWKGKNNFQFKCVCKLNEELLKAPLHTVSPYLGESNTEIHPVLCHHPSPTQANLPPVASFLCSEQLAAASPSFASGTRGRDWDYPNSGGTDG